MRLNSLLGEILIGKKMITVQQLSQALVEQKETREPLGQVLIRFGFITEANLRVALSEQLGISFVSPDELVPRIDQRLKEVIPPDFARKHLVLPLSRDERSLKIAVGKMPDLIFLDNLRKMTGLDILTVLSTEADIKRAIDLYYSVTDLQEVVSSSEVDAASQQYIETKDESRVDLESAMAEAGQAPVVRLVDMMIKKSLDDRASDILPPPPRELHNAVVSRIKIISKLDIAEKRVPQDGSFSLSYKARRIDVRVSTVPTVFGEKVVMRILDKRTDLLDLRALGFEEEQLRHFELALTRPYGLIFVTGPTGSGKSTTLYAALNKIHSPDINITTIEDPVEYQITGVNQVQVKPDIGLTFASGLRAFLRQDPDVILVGEVRDLETAEICIRASLTGHLVLSTLHTNDAVTAVTRLIDIGVQPYLVSGSIALVAAQRLIRLLCEDCKEAYRPTDKERSDYGIRAETIYRAKGCSKCRNIGYWGRAAIYEVIPVDEDIRRLIVKDANLDAMRRLQKEKKYETLFQNGLKKVERGVTTIEEILSVAYE
ncbi:MAG: Type II secretion system protein E [Candidatus Omnitrophica bacterium ADurb.Bin314]|nr:MAG: Type II secretion system protein E [Candidatus Omnitrophica bacterium ADurb.Bin314]